MWFRASVHYAKLSDLLQIKTTSVVVPLSLSSSRHQLLVPRYRLSSLGRRSFAIAGPTTWNSLSADLRDPTCSDESFRRSLITFLFAKVSTSVSSALEVFFYDDALYKSTLSIYYLLHFLTQKCRNRFFAVTLVQKSVFRPAGATR